MIPSLEPERNWDSLVCSSGFLPVALESIPEERSKDPQIISQACTALAAGTAEFFQAAELEQVWVISRVPSLRLVPTPLLSQPFHSILSGASWKDQSTSATLTTKPRPNKLETHAARIPLYQWQTTCPILFLARMEGTPPFHGASTSKQSVPHPLSGTDKHFPATA